MTSHRRVSSHSANALSSSAPIKRGKDAKVATAEETAEWKEGLEECLEEVKKLETTVKY